MPRTRPPRTRWIVLLCAVGVVCGLVSREGISRTADEYEVKAAIMYNIAKFAEWPTEGDSQVFRLGILGPDPFGSKLEETILGKKVDGKPIIVMRFDSLDDYSRVDMLFVTRAMAGKMPEILEVTKGRAVLTVSDTKRGCEQGSVIGFVKQGSRVRFAVNAKSARFTNLTLSSKLLMLAVEVFDGPPELAEDR